MKRMILYPLHREIRRIILGIIGLSGSSATHAQEKMLAEAQLGMFAEAHIVFAIFTSAVLIAAFFLACTLWLQARRLHHLGRSASFLDKLPPVLTLEKLLFFVLNIGFILLTILVGSGMIFGEQVWGHALAFNHKVIFTLLSWLVFAVLLIGRRIYGWRGLTAVRATIFGFVLLFLAYVGTHFILDFVLKR